MRNRFSALLVASLLLFPACVTTSTRSVMMTEPVPGPQGVQAERHGHVEWVRETVRRTEGNPGAGAAAGAVIGGLLGGIITGRSLGAFVGATGGAVVGANASEVRGEQRFYDVAVRFDDGGEHVFTYAGYPPFQPGQSVSMTPRGLVPAGLLAAPSPNASNQAPPTSQPYPGYGDSEVEPPTPPPGNSPPPPPAGAPAPPASEIGAVPPPAPAGEWVFTEQYGWVWMPSSPAYTFTPDYEYGDPYMYVYYPAVGWTWVDAPWLWGWGPMPFVHVTAGVHFTWYGHGWGDGWRGYRPAHYHGGVARHVPAGRHHR